jgi:hypothetical protein
MKALERLLQSNMISSRWTNRHTTITFFNDDGGVASQDYVVVPDDEVICDNCNMCLSNYPNTPIYVLQYSYDRGATWEDSRALCSECAARYSVPVVVEEELLA